MSANDGDADSPLDAHAFDFVMNKFSGIFEVPKQNVHVVFTGNIEISIKKAVLKPEFFQDLHTPVTLTGV